VVAGVRDDLAGSPDMAVLQHELQHLLDSPRVV